MQPLGRDLIVLDVVIAAIGVLVSVAGKIPLIGRLPGDIFIKREHFSVYFPLTTCILISLVLILISKFFGRK